MFALENLILRTQGITLVAGEVIPDDVLIKALHEVFDNVKGTHRYVLLAQLHMARSDVLLKEAEKIAKESYAIMASQVPALKEIPTTVPAMMAGLTTHAMARYNESTRVDISLASLLRERVLINKRYLDKVANDQLPSI